MEVINVSGQLVFTSTGSDAVINLNVRPVLYYIRQITHQGTGQQKLMVQK